MTDVSPQDIAKGVVTAPFKAAEYMAERGVDGAFSAAQAVGEGFNSAGKAISDGAAFVGKSVTDGLNSAGQFVSDGIDTARKDAADQFENIGHAMRGDGEVANWRLDDVKNSKESLASQITDKAKEALKNVPAEPTSYVDIDAEDSVMMPSAVQKIMNTVNLNAEPEPEELNDTSNIINTADSVEQNLENQNDAQYEA